MAKIENYCQNELHRQVTVHGYLIGAMPDVKTVADDEILLVKRMKKAGPDTAWKVVGLRSLLEMAQDSHASVISSLEEDMKRDEASIERGKEIGRANGCTPVHNAPHVYRLMPAQ